MSDPQHGEMLDASAPAGHRHWRAHLAGPLVLLALVFVTYGHVLLRPAGRVIGWAGGDVAIHGLWWHALGYRELARGHLTLWNPYVYGGSPFHAGFQAALLYPLNWIGLLVPVHVTLNWLFALHVFLAGLFTYACCRGRGITRLGAVLAGAMFMFSGPYFLHAYPGHPTAIASMTWLPLLVLCADRLTETGRRRWLVLAAAAAAMQLYGGHVQYYYYTAIAGGIYALLHAATAKGGWRGRVRPVLAYATVYAGSVLLAAPQLFPAFEALPENSRGGGLPIEHAATFSLPPENLATIFSPTIFGAVGTYFGRIYFWEACLFIGVTGVVLAAYAVVSRDPRRRFGGMMVLATLLLALGYHTPLFRLMYGYFPGYDTFRGTSKFAFVSSLFIALLAAAGLDRLAVRTGSPRRWALITPFAIAGGLLVIALIVRADAASPGTGLWGRVLQVIQSTGESEARGVDYSAPPFIRGAALAAADALLIAAATAAVVGVFAWGHSRTRYAAYALVALGLLELTLFARANVALTDARPAFPHPWAKLLADNPGDYRVLLPDARWANWGIVHGFENIYGYDPSSITRRMAEFLAFSQGDDPDRAQQYFRFHTFPPQLKLLRCRYVLIPKKENPYIDLGDALPRSLLVSSYVVGSGRGDVLARIADPSFDPRATVVLESQPSPRPEPGGERASVSTTLVSTEELHIDVDVPTPTILLVTDNYSRLWQATPRAPGPQPSYEVMPANWVLRAIPLQPGRHQIRLRYEPHGVAVGFAVTGATLVVLAAAGILTLLRPRFGSRSPSAGSDNHA